MIFSVAKFQIGKNGLNEGVIDSLSLVFKNHKQVRVSMLKSSGRDRDTIEKSAIEMVEKLSEKMKCSFDYKIIGFTIILHKSSKSKTKDL